MTTNANLREIEQILSAQGAFEIPDISVTRNPDYFTTYHTELYQNYDKLKEKARKFIDVNSIQKEMDLKQQQIGTIFQGGYSEQAKQYARTENYRMLVDAINKIKQDLKNMKLEAEARGQLGRNARASLRQRENFYKNVVEEEVIPTYEKYLNKWDKLNTAERQSLINQMMNSVRRSYGLATRDRFGILYTYPFANYILKSMEEDDVMNKVSDWEIILVKDLYNTYEKNTIKTYVNTHLKNRVERLRRGEVFPPPSAPTEQGAAAAGGGGGRQPAYFQGVELLMPNQNNGAAAAGGGGGAALQQGGRKTKKQRKSSRRKTRRRN
jgi:hypothetical protein